MASNDLLLAIIVFLGLIVIGLSYYVHTNTNDIDRLAKSTASRIEKISTNYGLLDTEFKKIPSAYKGVPELVLANERLEKKIKIFMIDEAKIKKLDEALEKASAIESMYAIPLKNLEARMAAILALAKRDEDDGGGDADGGKDETTSASTPPGHR